MQNHSLLIKNVLLDGEVTNIRSIDGKIVEIGKDITDEADSIIECSGSKAALPPMVNAHTHSAMSLLRGVGDDLHLMEWLEGRIWPIEAKMNPDDIYWGMKFACLEMIKSGTVLFNDMYMYPEAALEAIKEMGIRAFVGLVMIDVPPAKDGKYVEAKYRELTPEQNDLVRLCISPHSTYTVSKESFRWAGEFAGKHDLILHSHVAETHEEEVDSRKRYGMSPVELMDEAGFLTPKTILAHGVWLSDTDIDILAKRGSSIVYNPISNMKLAVGRSLPYEKLKRAGVNVSLGTDGSASNNNLDIFEEMKVGSILQKHDESNPTILPADEMLSCATVNGMKAFGLDHGGIRVGGPADIVLIDLEHHSMLPGHDLASDLVYSASGQVVSDLICNGKAVMLDRKVKDEEDIMNEFKKRAGNLKKSVK